MMLEMSQSAPAFAWGFLVGFVAWESCFRLAQPIATWLLQEPSGQDSKLGLVSILVMVFLIVGVLVCLSLLPVVLILLTPSPDPILRNQVWRDLYGASFVGSLAGIASLGAIRRA